MSFNPEDFFLPELFPLLTHFIQQNDGNEVLIIGKVNEHGIVYEAEMFAMGNSYSVPAVLKAAQPGEILIHNHPTGDVRPSDADLHLAARAAENRVGSYIVDNELSKIFPVVRWIPPENLEVQAIVKETIASILQPEGLLNRSYQEYEFRKPQLDMALAVTDAINNREIIAAEAGTGTGKSFAYLIPAIEYCTKNKGRKAVITTSTIALEEQLVHKDIPFLKNNLGIDDLSVAILKGRHNYLCLRKFTLFRNGLMQLSIDEKKINPTIIDELDTWLDMKHDGSRTSLATTIDIEIWSEINADEHSCERSKCRYFENCYFYKARRRANFASILLINHHLLMADVSLKQESEDQTGILPSYDILVVDEAHNLFKSAISFLGESVSTYAIIWNLRRLYNNERGSGLLTKLYDHFQNNEITDPVEDLVRDISAFIPFYTNSIIPEFLDLIKTNDHYVELDNPHYRKKLKEGFNKVISFLTTLVETSVPALHKCGNSIERDPLKRSKEEDIIHSLLTDIFGVIDRIADILEFFTTFFSRTDTENYVFWAERSKRGIKFSMTPVAIQHVLVENLYNKIYSIIFSSATLATGNSEQGFDFFKREIGLEQCARVQHFLQLPSCFDHKAQLKPFIAVDLPEPNSWNFDDESIQTVAQLLYASKGGGLVLFTSIKHRQKAKELLSDFPFPIITQNDFSVSAVIKRFREDENSSLLATDTFWEGVDIKGNTLRNLIIVRLPFRFPSHPFIKRYVAMLEKKYDESGFKLFTLPNAILKFKQGLGRLIRTKNDRGIVTILDRRLMDKWYGRIFLEAISEDVNFSTLPSRMIVKEAKRFFS